jgi:phosphoribosylglycinamide formyltransferase-1
MNSKFPICVLLSGKGSNLRAILERQAAYQVAAVFSDKADAPGLQIAQKAGISLIKAFPRDQYPDKLSQKNAIYEAIESLNPNLICLAGFMQILEKNFVNRYSGKIINVHPSLLPKLTGLNTHSRAIEQGEDRHGCSIHFVDSGLDSGPIIAQSSCDVKDTDDAESLAAKVLKLEHRLYPVVVEAIALGLVRLEKNNKVFVDPVFEKKLSELEIRS